MSYITIVAGIELPPYAELYKILYSGIYTYYTSYKQDVSYNGNLYLSRPIKRNSIKYENEVKESQFKVALPADELMKRYITSAPPEPIYIEVIRVFLNITEDSIIIAAGELVGITISGNVATVDIIANAEIATGKVPRYVFQSQCNHSLFSAGCGLLKPNYKVEAVVTVGAKTLASATFAGYPVDYFTGGYVEYSNDMRMVTAHTGSVITLQFAFDSRVKDGVTVNAYPGCKGDWETCKNKYNNLSKFLGFPGIPSSNPAIWGLQ